MRASDTAKLLSAEVRGFMLHKGITRHDLAKQLGLASQTISDVLSGQNKSRKARTGIEDILFRPIWTTREDFASRHPGTIPAENFARSAAESQPVTR